MEISWAGSPPVLHKSDTYPAADRQSDKTSENAQKTETDRLTDLSAQLAEESAFKPGGQLNAISHAERFSSAQAFSMEIMTRDGDRITIDFSHQQSQTQILEAVSSNGYQIEAAGIEITAGSQFSYSVTGNLSVKERQAIQALVNEIGLIADDFFNGNIQNALQQAAEIDMDKSQLMDLNVNMRQSLTYAVSTAYTSVQQLEQPPGHPGRHLGQIKNNLERFINRPQFDFLEELNRFTTELIDQLVRQDTRFLNSDAPEQQVLSQNLERLASLLTHQESANV